MSNVERKEYGDSAPGVAGAGAGAGVDVVAGVYDGDGGAASSIGPADRVGPDAPVGDGVYAGGGSFEGTVKAFIPGRSGRLVAGDGLAKGLGLLFLEAAPVSRFLVLASSPDREYGLRSAGPLKLGVAGL